MNKISSKKYTPFLPWLFLISLIFLGILLQAVFTSFSQTFQLTKDFTKKQVYHLSEETKSMLSTVKEELKIYILASEEEFISPDPYFSHANEIIKKIEKENPLISLIYMDLNKNPNFLSTYPNVTVDKGDLLMVSPNTVLEIPSFDLFHITETPGQLQINSSKAESTLASAILSLQYPDKKTVGFVTGNDTYPTETVESLLRSNNYLVEKIPLSAPVPDSIDVLFLFAPKQDLSPKQVSYMDSFLSKQGKHAIYVSDNKQPKNLTNITKYLKQYGVSLSSDLVVETNPSRTYQNNPYIIMPAYENYTYAQKIPESNTYPVLPFPMPLIIEENQPAGIVTEELLRLEDSCSIRPVDAPADWVPEKNASNLSGMTLSTKKVGDSTSSLLVIPTASYFDGGIFSNGAIANANYFITILNRITDRSDVMPILFTSLSDNTFQLTSQEANIISLFFLWIIPFSVGIGGVMVYWKRNRK